jgi:acetoin:2,6-dichlorophenolindophenol oxidoreductase subunit alpha
MDFSKEQLVSMYDRMGLIRAFEERLMQLYMGGEIRGSLHPSVGQEASAVGSVFALNPDDYLTCTYRGHGAAIAKGVDVNAAMAEMLGRRTGISKGKGGSMHWTDPAIGLLGENAIVGAGVPIAAGAALTAQMDKTGRVALTIFGDGAVNQGVFLETLNVAQLWKLPLVLLCENNLYAEMTPVGQSNALKTVADRAKGFGMRATTIDGNDVCEVYETVAKAAQQARAGKGPTFIEALTYRLVGHMVGDAETYRTKDEVAEWRKRDPILRLRDELSKKHSLTDADFQSMADQVAKRIDAAVSFAKDSPFPEPEEALTDVWA